MSIINILDKKIYTQIAAGEVVERPSSVIKELIENSIDAGATEITVNIFGGGKDFIEVIDNGHGITKEDLTKAILPHATSKIKELEDIYSIKSLGFRGEALSSIASVSKLKITSKTKDCEIGYSLTATAGEDVKIFESPTNNGTYVCVSNLFFNTPARQKFLKTVRSEENDVTDLMTRMILSHPNVSFKFLIEDKTAFNSYGDGVDDAISSVYGNSFLDECFKISNYIHGVKVNGYISKINYSKANRTYQTVVLNGRVVQNQTIGSAISNAYSPYLMKRRYPACVLYITLPAEIVDVNVTPNKSDVRFIDNSVIYGAVYSTISKVLDGSDSALNIVVLDEKISNFTKNIEKNENSEDSAVLITTNYEKPNTSNYKHTNKFEDLFGLFTLKEDNNIFESKAQSERPPEKDDVFLANKRYIEELENNKKLQQTKFVTQNKLEYVGQALNAFLIFEMAGDLYIVDQHAAHERLIYNKLLYNHTTKDVTVQPLIVPFTVKVNAVEREFVIEKLPFIKELGIEIEASVDGNFNVYAIPNDIVDVDLDKFFKDVISDYSLRRETIPEVILDKLMQKACKSAVKAGMKLDKSEVDSLVTLLNGNVNLKCPHGRPIAVRVSRNEIDKWFKRVL